MAGTGIPTYARRGLNWLLLALVGAIGYSSATTLAAAPTQKRVALVIANSEYTTVPRLPNPVNDGRLIARSLQKSGFQSVVLLEDQSRAGMEGALRQFAVRAEQADVALVYFAGHGIEFNGENYLIPVDARLVRDRDLDIEAIKLSTVMSLSEGAKRLRIIVLDACRTPPQIQRSVSTRSLGRGLAPVEPEGESLVVYSAKAGTPALDGTGANSPFAVSLARRLIEPGREISLMFRQVRDDVLTATDKVQEPFTYGSLSSQEFYFVDPPKIAAARVDMEAEGWSLCRDGAGAGPCQSYLATYPRGKFSGLVKARMADLAAVRPPGASVPSAALAATAPPRPVAAAAPEFVQQLGLHVVAQESGFVIGSVQSSGLAFGQLFAGDIILNINSAAPQRGVAVARQVEQALASGYVKFLVKRGPSTSLVIIRKVR